MLFWIVRQEIEHLDLDAYRIASKVLRASLEQEIGHLYRTTCAVCGRADASVKYFLWVKTKSCDGCGADIDLFPGYLVAGDARHPKNVFVCPDCGELTETKDRKKPGNCAHCGATLLADGPAKRNQCACPKCAALNRYPMADAGPPRHHLFAMEYHCETCRSKHTGRFFKKPDSEDLARVEEAEAKWTKTQARFVPDDAIPPGDETDRLHRWGYRRYREMFNSRQLLGLERSACHIARVQDDRVRNALATNLSDLLRYQNMLCRYDTMALKSLDIFSVHGFPVGLVECESNLLGIVGARKGICVGSGGWANIIEKFHKAKSYCDGPFEVRHQGQKKVIVPIQGEWIGDHANGDPAKKERVVELSCGDAAVADIAPGSLDAVFTDPPYFGNVQYAELMDFCYVWLRKLQGETTPGFVSPSTRRKEELTGNESMGRDLAHFTEGLSAVFQRMEKALKVGAPLVFTYHHNDLKAYYPVAVAVLDAGLTCSASMPCPAEMGASIHINRTGSSIVDTVFVCRKTGKTSRSLLPDTPQGLSEIVEGDCAKLEAGNVKPTQGDITCIVYGHLIRLAIWSLRKAWRRDLGTRERIAKVDDWIREFGDWRNVVAGLVRVRSSAAGQSGLRSAPRSAKKVRGVQHA